MLQKLETKWKRGRGFLISNCIIAFQNVASQVWRDSRSKGWRTRRTLPSRGTSTPPWTTSKRSTTSSTVGQRKYRQSSRRWRWRQNTPIWQRPRRPCRRRRCPTRWRANAGCERSLKRKVEARKRLALCQSSIPLWRRRRSSNWKRTEELSGDGRDLSRLKMWVWAVYRRAKFGLFSVPYLASIQWIFLSLDKWHQQEINSNKWPPLQRPNSNLFLNLMSHSKAKGLCTEPDMSPQSRLKCTRLCRIFWQKFS